MRWFPRMATAVLIVTLSLAACGEADPSSAAGCPEVAPTPLPTPPHADDPELAARLPTELDGTTFDVQTMCLTVANSGGIPVAPEFLEAVGVDASDVTMGVLTPLETADGATYVGLTAWRYAGAEEVQIRSAFMDALADAEIPVEEETIGGKDVVRALFAIYHVEGDALYSIIGEDPEVEAMLEALP